MLRNSLAYVAFIPLSAGAAFQHPRRARGLNLSDDHDLVTWDACEDCQRDSR